MREACRLNDLCTSKMSAVRKGNRDNYKGWRVLTEQQIFKGKK